MKKKSKTTTIGLCCCAALVCALAIAGMMAHAQTKMPTSDGLASENEQKTYVIPATASLAVDVSDPANMVDMSQYVAIVRVDSLDGTDNYSKVNQEFVSPYTYGHLTVIESIEGELPVGESLKFYRLGGAVPVAQYYESLREVEKERFDSAKALNKELAAADLIEILHADDIRIEAGKTYLVYMVDETVYDAAPGTYAIIGLKGGLREVRLPQPGGGEAQTNSEGTNIKVLNNFTNTWDNLSDVISKP